MSERTYNDRTLSLETKKAEDIQWIYNDRILSLEKCLVCVSCCNEQCFPVCLGNALCHVCVLK